MVIMARSTTERRKTIILPLNNDNFDQPNELASAIFSNDLNKIREFIINKDILLTPIDLDGSSCLHLSSYFNKKEITDLFIKAGLKVDLRDNEFYTPLHSACLNNSSDCVKLLIDRGADLNSRTKNWLTPLHICATTNSYNCLVHLIKNEASLNITDDNQLTALHYSTMYGFTKITSELLSAGANPKLKDLNGSNCLHYASLTNNLNIMKLLLEEELDINQKDNYHLTPLHYACITTNYQMVEFLIDNGADINVQDKSGNTPLHYACIKFSKLPESFITDCESTWVDYNICELLISKNAKINLQNNLNLQPIHLAVRECALTIAYRVQNLNFDCRDYLGRTPLHIACYKGYNEFVDLLIEYGVDLRARDKFNRTPLHYAIESNQIKLVKKLIKKDPELISLVDDYNCNLLFYAASFNNIEIWNLLIRYYENRDQKDNFGRCIQFYAAHSRQLLQSCLPLTDNLDKYNRNLLFYTLTKTGDSHESLDYLLSTSNLKLDINQRDIYGRTPLHYAFLLNLELHFEILLRHNASLHIEDFKNLTPIHYLIIADNFDTFNNLINISVIDLNENRYRVCLMQLAAYYGSNNCLQLLIKNNYKNHTNLTRSLEYAVWQKKTKCVDTILKWMVKLDKISDLYKCNALEISALNSDFNCFDRLIVNLEKCDLYDEYGRTTMMFALVNCKNRNYCIDSLLKREDCNLNATDKECRNVLFYCVYYENLEMVKLFLQLGVNALQKCLSGKTVLHLAAIVGNLEIFDCLLQNLKQNNISYDTLLDNDGLDPFHYACYNGNSSIVKLLIETFPEKNSFLNHSSKKINYLHLAAYSGDEECIKLILNQFEHSIVNKLDSKGRNALHYLCMSKIISLPYSPTNNISQHHLTPQNNLSSIEYEINKKQLAAYKLLINNQININCKDKFGKTPLMIALQNSPDCRLSLCLIDELQIDLTTKDINQQTVLHYACIYKNELAGQKLIRKDSSLVNLIDNKGLSALHIAASNGLFELTKSLLSIGASCFIQDSDGMTPALSCAKSADVADCLDLLIEVMVFERSQQNETSNISYNTTISNHHQSRESIRCSSPILDHRKSLISQRSRRSESNSSRRSELISSFEDDLAFKN